MLKSVIIVEEKREIIRRHGITFSSYIDLEMFTTEKLEHCNDLWQVIERKRKNSYRSNGRRGKLDCGQPKKIEGNYPFEIPFIPSMRSPFSPILLSFFLFPSERMPDRSFHYSTVFTFLSSSSSCYSFPFPHFHLYLFFIIVYYRLSIFLFLITRRRRRVRGARRKNVAEKCYDIVGNFDRVTNNLYGWNKRKDSEWIGRMDHSFLPFVDTLSSYRLFRLWKTFWMARYRIRYRSEKNTRRSAQC